MLLFCQRVTFKTYNAQIFENNVSSPSSYLKSEERLLPELRESDLNMKNLVIE